MEKDIWKSEGNEEEDIWKSEPSDEWIVSSEDMVIRINGKVVEKISKKEIIRKAIVPFIDAFLRKHKIKTCKMKLDGTPLRKSGVSNSTFSMDMNEIDIFTEEYKEISLPEKKDKLPDEGSSPQKYHRHEGASGLVYSHLITENHKNQNVIEAHNKTVPTIKQ